MAVFKENYKAEMQEKLQKLVKEGVAKEMKLQAAMNGSAGDSKVQKGRIPASLINGGKASPRGPKNFIEANKLSSAKLTARSPVRMNSPSLNSNLDKPKSSQVMARSSSKGAIMKAY